MIFFNVLLLDIPYSYYLERTPLITAAGKGFTSLVELFLNSGASVQEKDKYGNSTFRFIKYYIIHDYSADVKILLNLNSMIYYFNENFFKAILLQLKLSEFND